MKRVLIAGETTLSKIPDTLAWLNRPYSKKLMLQLTSFLSSGFIGPRIIEVTAVEQTTTASGIPFALRDK